MDIFSAAKYFLSKVDEEEGVLITHLKLQKIVYYAQAWYLAIYGRRLFEDKQFEAWAHGPVNPELFQVYRGYGYQPIPFPEDFDPTDYSRGEKDYLDQIWSLYGRFDAKYLEALTHKEEPWLSTRGDLPEGARCDTPISDDLMTEYYGGLVEDE
ncbi:Panacea domain-containing protein [Paenibacillus wynnii]|uniref:Antitoxin SocA-like Panacea domain-containing protein n=1 Tax=Paenibacillus wynnii TaxID=268407 RepID=A0A098MDP3_9BACL|nr:type II toxin-antitoxin system antitoxin SocA domain-containing protein [Paenibacillus wynnii]KGE20685.1 hypothetical protein PWYN_00360 [Paenibacillus wynnii]